MSETTATAAPEDFDPELEEEQDAPRDLLVDGPELFPGDTGTLPLKLRQALIRLVRGPYLDANSSDHVYETVVDNQEQLRVRLSELFLSLVIDEDRKVALLRPVEMAEPHTSALQRQREMTREETLLLLRMRLILDRHTGTGNDATIARQDIVEVLEGYVDPGQRDAKSIEDTADAAIRKLVQERRLLLPTELDNVWVISNALPLALPYSQVGDIITFMQTLGGGDNDDDAATFDVEPADTEPATNDGEEPA
ncbi:MULTISPECIES: DUF4194 domain-containing protein [unclassified Arthrobacter]|uniref:DUF4194 domain-containing protein n=1 Tax=unclassified Arthrobacter TaxID=235627 RepID=UPI001E5751AF|nr:MULTISPECIES: DUF4194 domain-containing protein [unclassified Arthrobacter]MCC9146851.1 DUF4194 domain-containing protein [Arthrobacter sp. zg-Y919]MDK1278082.1 DUF4194 domain-containing protein [Arthrobacter sp. zg.Y919]WIB03330.1 DUF4194 domain-containing protein [Arthrobacter sp. zg-Y919]